MEKALTHGITIRDKAGYALGDFAGLLIFGMVNAFLQMFYSDVLHISLTRIAVLMLIARIWDAVNDPMWGGFIDSRRPTKYGRFRPYILGASFPLAVSSVLMFTKIPGLTDNQYLVYAYITYIFYGMMYTGTNIPYGSVASVITDDELERSALSVWRSIGSGLGGLPSQVILPLVVYTTAVSGAKVLDPQKLFYAVTVLAAIMLFAYFGSFKLTKERVSVPESQNREKYSIINTIRTLLKNRPFVILCLISMFIITFQLYSQTIYNYLFKDFYEKPGLFSLVTVCTYLPMAMLIPVMSKLVRRFGKKELCAFGMGFSAVVNLVLFLLRYTPLMHNPYVFIVFAFFSGLGQTFLLLEVWALVMDVIDYQESLSRRREEGTSYAFYSFVRKLGHTVAASGASLLLAFIGYDIDRTDVGQSSEVLYRLYDISTVVPAVLFAVIFILLMFCYPLNKARLAELHEKLTVQRNTEAQDEL